MMKCRVRNLFLLLLLFIHHIILFVMEIMLLRLLCVCVCLYTASILFHVNGSVNRISIFVFFFFSTRISFWLMCNYVLSISHTHFSRSHLYTFYTHLSNLIIYLTFFPNKIKHSLIFRSVSLAPLGNSAESIDCS